MSQIEYTTGPEGPEQLDLETDMDSFEYQEHLASLSHEPGQLRQMNREIIFATLWRQFMTAPPDQREIELHGHASYPIDNAVQSYPHPLTQEDATLMATIFTWFGSNVGQDFLEKSFSLREVTHGTALNFMVLGWAHENLRVHFVGHGQRTLEALASHIKRRDKNLYQKDYELIEQMMLFLGHGEGLNFLEACRETVQRAGLAKVNVVPEYNCGGYQGVIDRLRETVTLDTDRLLPTGF